MTYYDIDGSNIIAVYKTDKQTDNQTNIVLIILVSKQGIKMYLSCCIYENQY